jgi:NAD dependent epimerase/dehydratase family enzyme
MIVITTPTGDIGHQVLKHVVQGSEPVRVIARASHRKSASVSRSYRARTATLQPSRRL